MDAKAVDQMLSEYVRVDTYPVAIKLCRDESEVPARARRPLRDLGDRITVCQAYGMARRYGWVLAVGKEDQICPYGMLMLGHLPRKKQFDDGSVFESLDPENREMWSKSAHEVAYLEHGKFPYLVVAPLHRADFEPDVLCVYGNSAMVMRLVQGAVWRGGTPVRSASVGTRDCADIIAQAYNTGEPWYVLPCNGDRIFGMAQDHEMAFTTPWSHVERILDGVAASHKSGLQRFPTTTFLRFQPQMPASYNALREFLEE